VKNRFFRKIKNFGGNPINNLAFFYETSPINVTLKKSE
jgi:hypothetical protein